MAVSLKKVLQLICVNQSMNTTLTCSVDKIDAVIVLCVSPASRTAGHVTVLQHVGHLEVGGDLVDAVLGRSPFRALGNVVLSWDCNDEM